MEYLIIFQQVQLLKHVFHQANVSMGADKIKTDEADLVLAGGGDIFRCTTDILKMRQWLIDLPNELKKGK